MIRSGVAFPFWRWTGLILAGLLSAWAQPKIGQPTDVFVAGQDGYHTYRIPSILRAANGDLLAFCEGRKVSRGDAGDIDILLKRSSDGGKTWSAAQIVWDDADNTCGNPCPMLDASTGTLWLLLSHNLGSDQERDIVARRAVGTRTVWLTHSEDHGRTWASPREITAAVKDPTWTWYATGPGVGIQLQHGSHAGRLVVPCDHIRDGEAGPVGGSHAIFSDDHGQTWQRGAAIAPQMNECQVAELFDGKGTLLMSMRTNTGRQRRAQATSSDGGATWSGPKDALDLPDPGCEGSVLRHETSPWDGLLLFSNPAHPEHRVNLTVRASLDGGATWRETVRLDEGAAAYSCLVSLSPEEAGCLYECGDTLPYRRIRFVRFPVAERRPIVSRTLHYKPPDRVIGDVHPFFQDGECYLFYLQQHTFASALVRTRDWREWTETLISHAPSGPGEWAAPAYYALGAIRDPAAGVYRSFYGHERGQMASSLSTDLLHWRAAPKAVCVPAGDYYRGRRDPFVFWIPERKEYGCVMTTWMKGRTETDGGAISLATSPDLINWTDHGAVLFPGDIGEPECPQMFQLGRRWYLLASVKRDIVGGPSYWMSDSPLGPWPKTPTGMLDGKDLCAAQLAFDGAMPVLLGWIPLEADYWGGHVALPREVYAQPDGTLSTRLLGSFCQRLKALPWRSRPEISVGREPQWLTGEGNNAILEFALSMPAGVDAVRLIWPNAAEVRLGRTGLSIRDGAGKLCSDLPVQLPADRAFAVSIVVEDDMVEVFVDDRYSLVARLPVGEPRSRIGLVSEPGAAHVSALRVAEIRWPATP